VTERPRQRAPILVARSASERPQQGRKVSVAARRGSDEIFSAKAKQIVEESARLFDRFGYHQTTMEDIASAVGLRKASVYHYFRSKEEILFQIHESFFAVLSDCLEGRLVASNSAIEIVSGSIADILMVVDQKGAFVRVFFEHMRELGPEEQEIMRARRDDYRHKFQHVIADGVAQGLFKDVNPAIATLGILGMCNWSYQWYRPSGRGTYELVAQEFAEIVLHGLIVSELS
jgi:AcrR family transcriptional regulator